MTGFDSKRQMAKAKVEDDDDTQVYADTLLIVYQRGVADGKQAAQRKPLTDGEIWQMVNDCTIGGDLHADKFARAIEAAHNIKE
jgi:hypothetical protein